MKKSLYFFILYLIIIKCQSSEELQESIQKEIQSFEASQNGLFTLWHYKTIFISFYTKLLIKKDMYHIQTENALLTGVNLYTRKLIKRDGVKKTYKLNNIFMDIRSDKINKEMTDDFDDEGKIKKNVKVSLTMDEEKYYQCILKQSESEFLKCVNKAFQKNDL